MIGEFAELALGWRRLHVSFPKHNLKPNQHSPLLMAPKKPALRNSEGRTSATPQPNPSADAHPTKENICANLQKLSDALLGMLELKITDSLSEKTSYLLSKSVSASL